MMKLRRVTMMVCDECLGEEPSQCQTAGCVCSSDHGAVVVVSRNDPALLDIDGFKMCARCEVKRAETVVQPGTVEELQFCTSCHAIVGSAYERLLLQPEVAQA